MKSKKLLAFALAMALLVTSVGIYALAQGDEATPSGEIVTANTPQHKEDSGVLPEQAEKPPVTAQPVQIDSPEPEKAESQPTPEGATGAPTSEPTPEGTTDAPTSEPTPEGTTGAPTSEPTQNAPHTNTNGVNMRAKPYKEAERVAKLKEGTVIQVTGKVVNEKGETWYAVIYEENTGYIRADLVDDVGDVPALTMPGEPAVPTEEPTSGPTTEAETEPTVAPEIESSDEPTAPPETEPTPIPETEPTAIPEGDGTSESENTPTPAPVERKVSIATSRNTEELELGSLITLTAVLKDFDGVAYTCRWQYAEADSDGNIIGEWQDAQEGALAISYVLTEENLLTAWRMCVTVTDPVESDPIMPEQ